MIERDRILLARAAQVNHNFGTAVANLIAGQDGGELPAGELRAIGLALSELSADFLTRAAELDGHTMDPTHRTIIDARSDA